MDKKGMLSQIISAFIIVVIGFYLIGPINDLSKQLSNDPNAAIVLGFVPILFAFVVIIVAVAMVYSAFRNVGGLGESGDYEKDEDEPEPEPKPHKQTYEEYVKERLREEKMMRTGRII